MPLKYNLSEEERIDNINRLERARIAFDDLNSFYVERQRNFRYFTGDQWSDVMKDPDSSTGEYIQEKDYIIRQGRLPAVQNQIGKTIRNLKGQFRTNYPDPIVFSRNRPNAQAGEMMTNALQYALDINETTELDAANLQEYGVSGVFGYKIGFKWRPELNRKDLVLNKINTTRFFYNIDAEDIRGTDITICGELHDMTIDEVLSKFNLTEDDREDVQALFPEGDTDDMDYKEPEHMKGYRDFYIADNTNKVRVIELWLKEYEQQYFMYDEMDATFTRVDKEWFIERGYDADEISNYSVPELVEVLNQTRMQEMMAQGMPEESIPTISIPEEDGNKYEEVWNCYYLTANGDLLFSMRTPYEHEEHPYVIGRFMMDGKILSFVSSIIDQQRHINRLISMIDSWIGGSLKNVFFIAEEQIPSSYKGNLEQYAEDIVRSNGVVFYKAGDKGVPMPKEISSKALPAGALQLLQIQSELLKDLSAVNDAVQGNAPASGTAASLYAQQTINASITNKDLFDYFFSVIRKRNRKMVQVIKQYYKEPRFMKVGGIGFVKGVEGMYEPESVRELDFEVVIGESENTLAYRQMMDTELKEFLDRQLITLNEYLEMSNKPFADKLLQMVGNRQMPEESVGLEAPDGGSLPMIN